MRVVIVVFFIIAMLNSCVYARGPNMKGYVKSINKSVYNLCNMEAYKITNNSDMYNCLKVNTSNSCNHLENFSSYIKEKDICTVNYESDLGTGIFIAIFGWVFLILLCQK